ncbi:hypothetical protein [Flavobacterium hercynium]|uniref:Uncharacterized protein n=1 Tax=Flavobacterium hercynium TaxID=387094 RepID=A0A226HK58_9FLAO|nr:hypothetical protein [Flavobacterium hercynium]OXA93870.1 hypothetical protein B0A66_05730 [Flavobacterium hercynium]SMP20655.1 hypothetical protein SAMN06265346_106219 [Flavobacterium hercynium]
MKKTDYELLLKTIGSPKEYSDGLYLVYIELYKTTKTFKKIISKHCTILSELEFGYICEVNMQGIPEIARSLALKNHAIYQIVRLGKITK